MLFVIDVGNTNTVMGIYRDDKLVKDWRIRTERKTTEDEFNLLAAGLFSRSHINFSQLEKSIISCVVPPMVAAGIGIIGTYWTIGFHDLVVIFDAPDEEAMSIMLFGLNGLSNVRSQIVQGFSVEEMGRILERLQ